MACPPIATGSEFLVRTLSHLDCQAQTLGTFGFQALAAAGSPAATVLTALLTLFIAIYGIRLLFGPGDEPRDLVNGVLKVGIVLTMALSWPAWRTVAYDTVHYGPPEIAATIMPATMPHPRTSLPQRLQGIDSGMAALTYAGTGRQVGEVINEGVASRFRSVALADETAFGWARPIFLASTIGAFGVLRIGGGLLLALAPLLAGLLLFDVSRGPFMGWLRGLVFVALGSLGVTVVLAVQLAVMEPWMAEALNRRNLGYATPTVPTELFALVLAFAVALIGMLLLLARVAFQNTWVLHVPVLDRLRPRAAGQAPSFIPSAAAREIPVHPRAVAISESVTTLMRREEARAGGGEFVRRIEAIGPPQGANAEPGPRGTPAEPLGSGHRRISRRETRSGRGRDERK